MTAADEAAEQIRKCTGCGLCLAACPDFAATRREGDSPRGRVRLIELLLAGDLDPADPTAAQHLSGCVECGACVAVCPTGVDVPRAREQFDRWMEQQ